MINEAWPAWELLGVAFAIFAVWSGLLLWAIKWMLDQATGAQRERFDAIDESASRNREVSARLERELLDLKAELPEKYVRREDAIRGETVLSAKVDALALRIENLSLRIIADGS